MDAIQTDRLIVRNFRKADAAGLLAYLHKPRAGCFLSERLEDLAAEEAERRAASDQHVAVCLKGTEALIGDMFCFLEEPDTYSVGWNFNADFEGKGFALEAARAFHGSLRLEASSALVCLCGREQRTVVADGRQNLVPAARPGMSRWREMLFAATLHLTGSATEYSGLPPGRLAELGSQVQLRAGTGRDRWRRPSLHGRRTVFNSMMGGVAPRIRDVRYLGDTPAAWGHVDRRGPVQTPSGCRRISCYRQVCRSAVDPDRR